jgi:radical S-adenosyl methionine domain-containing protein 2
MDLEDGRRVAVCGGCGPGTVRETCAGSFSRLGVLKVHWECWPNCNLSCGFCYRTRGPALTFEDAKRLVSTVRTAGAQRIVFAGGDPSLRPDIGQLVDWALAVQLLVEIQTNAHHVTPAFKDALLRTDLVGLSLDGATEEVHDRFRSTRGNFKRVFDLLDFLEEADVQVIIRTVVARPNYESIIDLGEKLRTRKNICKWSLLEFSPIGSGHLNRSIYELDRSRFDDLGRQAIEEYGEDLEIDLYRLEDKVGTYVLLTPDGRVYGTTEASVDGVFPPIGSILERHLDELAGAVAFRSDQHEHRYAAVEVRLHER